MNLKRMAPWNWFKSEQQDRQSNRELDPSYVESPPALTELHREVDRVFDEFFPLARPLQRSANPRRTDDPSFLQPTIDIAESDQQYTIQVEVPGVEKEDLDLEIREDALILRGEKRQNLEEKGRRFHRVESSYGSFQRVLDLPPDANAEDAQAKFRNGVLILTIAKTGESKATGRKIKIE